MAENKCCNLSVTETEKGFNVEITGEKIKDCFSSLLKCCSKDKDQEAASPKGCC